MSEAHLERDSDRDALARVAYDALDEILHELYVL